MCLTPRAARVANQTSITGPNTAPMRFVPLCWTQKSPARTTQAIHITTEGVKRSGLIAMNPSAAPSTEIAGVMIPSP